MKDYWNAILLSQRFFIAYGIMAILLIIGFYFEKFFPIAQFLLLGMGLLTLLDFWLLYSRKKLVDAHRIVPKVLSLGDENIVKLAVLNLSNQKLRLEIIDELPYELQVRDFSIPITLASRKKENISYPIRPLRRGLYEYGNINVICTSRIGLIQRRVQILKKESVPVFPSILQMKNLALKAFGNHSNQKGIKKIRRLGHSYEFEQIKNYVRGDDYRSINWKASSRSGELMVNTYQDERAQQVYCVIDKSRVMRMPFDGLSLMDYAINTALVISNIVLKKQDKAGLITFSDVMGATIKAERKPHQLHRIMQALYEEKERNLEANYELLYHSAQKLIKGRSLFLLFTNFENQDALERVLPILRRINKFHLLVVVFFENTEVQAFAQQETTSIQDIYLQTIAQDYLFEKEKIAQILRKYGIQTIFTQAEDLAVNTINKYLELKARGLI